MAYTTEDDIKDLGGTVSPEEVAKDIQDLGGKPVQEAPSKLPPGYALASSPTQEDNTPGMMGTFLRSAENTASLSNAPRINGALEALLDKFGGSKEGISDLYNKHKIESKLLMQAGEAANPYSAIAGNVAGGAALAGVTGGAGLIGEGVGGAAELGGLMGAGNAYFGSDDPNADVKDALIGAGTGAATGAIGGVAGKYVGKYAQNRLQALAKGTASAIKGIGDLPLISHALEGVEQGFGNPGSAVNPNGRFLMGSKDSITDDLNNVLGENGAIRNDLQSELNKAQIAKSAAINGAEKKLGMQPWLKSTYEPMMNAASSATEGFSDVSSEMDQIRRVMQEAFGADEEGNLLSTELTPQRAQMLKARLGNRGSQGGDPFKTPEALAVANRLLSTVSEGHVPMGAEADLGLPQNVTGLKDYIADNVAGVADPNARLSQLLKLRDAMPTASDIVGNEGQGFSPALAEKLQTFEKALPPDMAPDINSSMEDLSQAVRTYRNATMKGLGHGPAYGLIGSSAKAVPTNVGNFVGMTARAAYNSTPEFVKDLSAKVASIGGETAQGLSRMLASAADKDQIGRNALIFAAQQNPAYRALLAQATGDNTEE